MHLKDLRSDPRNRRKHTPRNVGMLVDSLQKVGAARSIVIDEEGEILAGNATVEAAAEAGITKVQVVDADGETIIAVRRSGLSEKQKRDLAIYDNRTAELAEWDLEQLKSDQDAGEDMSAFFGEKEIEGLLKNVKDVDLASGDINEKPDMRELSLFLPAEKYADMKRAIRSLIEPSGGVVME